MKLVTYLNQDFQSRLGMLIDNQIIDIQNETKKLGFELPSNMLLLLNDWDRNFELVKNAYEKLKSSGDFSIVNPIKLLSPIPNPPSCRDGYAFRQHVEAARRNRGLDMIPEFDQYPIFYFTNHNAIFGEGEIEVEIDHLDKLDFELEWAAIIGKRGKNINSNEADNYIAGFTIMNDFSARTLQMEEMKLNLGPAKGKDFATTLGPWLVTTDELESKVIKTQFGNKYKLEMKARHNGIEVSYGNTSDMNWTFAEIIERASYGVELFPGDVIGSGTVGTGCYLELNGTRARLAKDRGEDYQPIWLQDGDIIELEIENLGILKNKIKWNGSNHSILKKKKI
ncbi:MAG: fumarylacetoacetate hydrolase family protein [Candidatus Kapabacteria bacterium]|nr:fumarylacetoacetate hydrolase family protein [Candidatus Kapabacteria bacterium]